MIKVNNREDFLKALMPYIPEDAVCVELGVFRGDFSRVILDILNPLRLYLVDPWEIDKSKVYSDNGPTAYSTNTELEQVREQFRNDSRALIFRGYSYDAVKSFPDHCLDFIYIDASHLYEDVKRDLNGYLPKLKPGGLMCGHDYFDTYLNFGVVKAVDEFIEETDFEMIVLNEEQHDWALKRK